MKLKTKIIIDRFIGKPFVYLLNVLARLLGKLLNINHQLNEVPNEIVICKFIGLGSIIQATPLIQTLKANFPTSKLTFLTTAGNKSMFEFIPEIDEVYCIADKNLWSVFTSSITILFKCWKKRPDVYIDLEIYSNFSSAFSVLSISKNRLGYFKNRLDVSKGNLYTSIIF